MPTSSKHNKKGEEAKRFYSMRSAMISSAAATRSNKDGIRRANSWQETHTALQELRETLTLALPGGAAQAEHLLTSYGLRAQQLVEEAQQSSELEPLSAVIPVSRAEWRFNHRHELARNSADLLDRRSRIGFLDQGEAERLSAPAATWLEELSSASPSSHQLNP